MKIVGEENRISQLSDGGSYILPCCLFSCESLTILKIDIMDCLLKVPSSVHLRSLKCLYLSHLTLGTNCCSLFSGCPVLEELKLGYCEWQKIKYLTIANSSLKSLSLTFDHYLDFELAVYATSLTSFHFSTNIMIDVSILGAPSLVNAYVQVYHPVGREHFSHRIIKLLGGMGNVESLKVHDCTLKGISKVKNFLVHLPVFHNLIHLEVCGVISCHTANVLLGFVQKTPNLETLSVCQVSEGIKHDQWILDVVPCCSKLKTFSISFFNLFESEMHLVELVLKSAAALETVKIKCSSSLSGNSRKLEFARKEVQLLPRLSENCVTILS